MSFSDHADRLDEAVMRHLGDGPCTYQGSGFVAQGAPHILDRDWEVYDENQVAMRVTTVSVWASSVPESRQGDQVITADRTWTVQQILEDDGYMRRLWVS